MSLLEKRLEALLDEHDALPVYGEDGTRLQDSGDFQIKLLGCYLLATEADSGRLELRASLAFVHCLMLRLPESYMYEMMQLGLDVATGRKNLAIDWSDLKDLQLQVLARKIIDSSDNIKGQADYIYNGKGAIEVKDGVLNFSLAGKTDFARAGMVPVFSVLDNRLLVLSDKSDKIKQSDYKNISVIDKFTEDYIREIRKKPAYKKCFKTYETGSRLYVKITGKHNGHLQVCTLDPSYERIEGELMFIKTILYYSEVDFFKYLNVGDIIEAVLTDDRACMFDIAGTFVDFVVNDTQQIGDSISAKVKEVSYDRKGDLKALLWTEDGYPVYAYADSGLEVGDMVRVTVQDYGSGKYFGIINVEISSDDNSPEDFYEEDTKRYLIQWFTLDPEGIAYLNDFHTEELHRGVIKDLCRIVFLYQKALTIPSEKYAVLCILRIIEEIISACSDSTYLKFLTDYLENLENFARGDKMMPIERPDDLHGIKSVDIREELLEVLGLYGEKKDSDLLDRIVARENDSIVKKVAVLVQSGNRLENVISRQMQNAIKREILKTLSLATDETTDFVEDNGEYLGIENDRQEFKYSFFIAPQNAKEQNQPVNIMKGVCAFLNSPVGGTLFLGVNDLGYVCGISQDLDYLDKKILGNYSGLDGYIRYITDYIRRTFSLDVAAAISVRPMYDDKAIAVVIPPYEYGVVCVDGVAYIRVNSETVRMTDAMRRNLAGKRILHRKDRSCNIAFLQEAISAERTVILHGYSSSNSGDVSDRTIEPFMFVNGHTRIVGYDLEKSRNSVFNISRIGSVEILDCRWKNRADHKVVKTDIFGMSGEAPVHINIALNLRAKNILVEEYPDAAPILIPTGDAYRWLLDTDVYSMKGIGRFYIGLAADIEIIDAPGLKDYAREYSEKYLLQ